MNQQKYLFLGGVNHRKYKWVPDGTTRINVFRQNKNRLQYCNNPQQFVNNYIAPIRQEYEKIKICDGGFGNNAIYVFKYVKNSNDKALQQYERYMTYKAARKYRIKFNIKKWMLDDYMKDVQNIQNEILTSLAIPMDYLKAE